MMCRAIPNRETLRALLDYDPSTGELRWRPRPVEMFLAGTRRSPLRAQSSWNGHYAGKLALNSEIHGYRCGHIFGESQRAHRVIWKWMTGEEPDTIDHINGNGSDNRWANLRSIPRAENARNVCLPRTNTSGRVGVSYRRSKDRWIAQISANGRKVMLGTYRTKQEAIRAREKAERELGYHPNHGRRAAA